MSSPDATPPDNVPPQASDSPQAAFQQAAEEPDLGLVREFLLFLRENKAWWMVPILLCLALLALAVWISSSPVAPFIYPLF